MPSTPAAANADDWDKPREFLGHAVENGHINYLSVSATEKAAPRAMGCFRRWFYRYVLGDKEPEKESSKVSKKKGVLMHDRLAHYARTGENTLQAPEINGIHMLPKPGTDLWVEQPFHLVTPGVDPQHPIITSSLMANGIPYVGYIDLAHGRLETWTEDDGHIIDPVGTVEVIDHKFKSNAKDRNGNYTYKHPGELVQTIQMAGYGVVVANTQPHAERVRLSHLYYPEKGDKPRKVTRLHVLDDCLRSWEYVEGVARTLVDVAKETDVNRVDGNVQACDALGGCPYRDKCTKYQTTSLDNLWQKVAKDFTKETNMGLLTNNPQIMPQQQVATAPQQPAPQPLPYGMSPSGGPGIAQDMRAQLAAEEAQMKAQQVQQQATLPTVQQPNFLDAWTRLMSFNRGYPALGGAAAMAYALAGGQSIAPGSMFPGYGELGRITLMDPAHVLGLLGELEQAARNQQQPPLQQAAPVVQQAPQQTTMGSGQAFTQQVAAQYNATVPPQQQVQYPQTTQLAPVAGGLLAPGTPDSQPNLAQQQTAPVQPPQAEPEAPKKGRGRPKKNDSGTTSEAAGPGQPAQTAANATTPPSVVVSAPQVTPTSAPDSDTPMILINARTLTGQTKSLDGYVDYVNERLATMYNKTKSGEQGPLDVRAAVEGSILGFGGWKGCVRECVKADPPPPGLYHLDTHMDDLREAVADGLRALEGKGWLIVRGVR